MPSKTIKNNSRIVVAVNLVSLQFLKTEKDCLTLPTWKLLLSYRPKRNIYFPIMHLTRCSSKTSCRPPKSSKYSSSSYNNSSSSNNNSSYFNSNNKCKVIYQKFRAKKPRRSWAMVLAMATTLPLLKMTLDTMDIITIKIPLYRKSNMVT